MLLSIGQFPHGEAGVFNIFVLSGNGALDEVGCKINFMTQCPCRGMMLNHSFWNSVHADQAVLIT